MVNLASKWTEVIQDPDYQALSLDEKQQLKLRYWNNVVLKDPDTLKLKKEIFMNWMQCCNH